MGTWSHQETVPTIALWIYKYWFWFLKVSDYRRLDAYVFSLWFRKVSKPLLFRFITLGFGFYRVQCHGKFVP